MSQIFLSAFVMGLAYCAVPGAINAEAIRRAIAQGFRAALLFQIGALAGDAAWAAVALSGVAAMRPYAGLHLILGVCGALLLVGMAWGTVRDSLRGHTPVLPRPRRHTEILLGALLSLANPFAVVFWLSVGSGLLPAGALAPGLPAVAIAVGGFILATLIWSVLLAAVASCGRALVTTAALRCLNAGAGVCMALFGFGLFWQTLAAY